jgi:hypothetical protein
MELDVESVKQFASLVAERNAIDSKIGELIGRPALVGHLGEWIAQQIFGVAIDPLANRQAIDGTFTWGPPEVVDRTVNVKWYAKRSNILDMSPRGEVDYYLVLCGPREAARSSVGMLRPLTVDAVYLFDAHVLRADIIQNGRRPGTATSLRGHLWEEAEIYPAESGRFPIDAERRALLQRLGSGWSSAVA